MYQPYVDTIFYKKEYKGTLIPDEELEKKLKDASRHIDSLTFNRIVERGFKNLTEFQQDIVKETICLQAEFEYENADILETVLSGYSLNGASVQFGSNWNVITRNGVAMKKDVYDLLAQTGLCTALLGRW